MGAPQTDKPTGPDFALGAPLADIPVGGSLPGHVDGEPVLVSERDGEYFAISAQCTHYGAPLADGIVVGDTVRCPWHHACFSLRTGEVLAAPAFDDLSCWRVEQDDGKIFVRKRMEPSEKAAPAKPRSGAPKRIVIAGGGAAGFAAAERLRRLGYDGELTMLSAEKTPPCDRPNLSKDYLAGAAPEEWLWIKDEAFYKDRRIELRLDAEIRRIDAQAREVVLTSRKKFAYDALLIATGAQPHRPLVPGFDRSNVYVLRNVDDTRAIIKRAKPGKRAVVVGAGFIGMEVAASLRARGLDVHVVAPGGAPLEHVLGAEIGGFVRKLHEENGVVFHLDRTIRKFDGRKLSFVDGDALAADFLVLGTGVRPRVSLAADAGIAVEDGIVADAHLQTSVEGVFAAGDVAQYPDGYTGERLRVEHWVVAQRQGQAAAANMLGERTLFMATPYFWSAHYGQSIQYVGHARRWDRIEVDGSIENGEFTARYFLNETLVAAASLGRDVDSLEIEAEMERGRRRNGVFA